jgi:hypothetical protein
VALDFGPFRERCQFENSIYRYVPPFATLRELRRAVRRLPDRNARHRRLGTPSGFAVGDWVHVLDADAIRKTLDERAMLRGLSFTPEQWASCGRTFQVETVVQRLMNDNGLMRPISRTVTLSGVTCDGPEHKGGCGRACPLLFRDEWLERSQAEHAQDEAKPTRFARVKSLAQILATLDRNGRRDGVMFFASMERFAGVRLPVVKQVQPVSATWWRRPGADWFILSGARCLGEQLQSEGPCHRGCGLLWHHDWLEFEE